MKFFAFGLLVVFPLFSHSTLLVPAYNENYCPNIDETVVVVRDSVGDQHLFETHRLLGIVTQWNQSFMVAGDLVVANNRTPLCVGLMNDGVNPNAAAVGKYFLLMGQSLIKMLEDENGVGTPEKVLKEKFVLAHEYAHVLQNLHELKFDYTLPLLSTKIKEQHADCMASYMMSLNGEITDELSTELEGFIQQLADAHIVGDHGTKEQRTAAYRSGLALGSIQRIIYGRHLKDITSSQLVQGCADDYRPTNLDK